jgi:uncharacterized membrane protein YecN with MAPEG domain
MDISAGGHAVALWAGLNLILLVALSVLVVSQRRRHHVSLGDGGVPELARAIRAFGNATEYVPTGLVALAVLALAEAPPVLIHLLGLALLAGRMAHALGLTLGDAASRLRSLGLTITWSAYVAGAAALLFYAIP